MNSLFTTGDYAIILFKLGGVLMEFKTIQSVKIHITTKHLNFTILS